MKKLAAGAVIAALLGACGGSDDNIGPTDPTSGNGVPSNPATSATGFTALFVPLSGVLPYPNDAYFAGSTDGTLNMPASSFSPVTFTMPGSTVAEPVMNALDGFSTTDAISARFDGNIDASTLTPANVIVLQVTTDLATKGVTGVVRPLVPDTDYSVRVDAASTSTLQILPLKPLAPKSSYLVVLTNGIKNSQGAAAGGDADFAAISSAIITEFNARSPSAPPAPASCTAFANATLKALCQLTSTHFLIARAAQINLSNIVLTFSFTTQSISDTLAALNATAIAGAYTLANTGLTTAQAVPGLPGIAQIYAGTLRVPYYLAAPSAANPLAPLNQYWLSDPARPSPPGIDPNSRLVTRFKPVPVATANLDIPLLLTIPTSGGPGPNGWPVVIFQHGTPRTRGDALLVADSFAAAGFATIAIDLPLHGITPTDAFAPLRQAGRERTFDLDLVNNTTLAPGPDGAIDDTGTHFLNLANVLVARDNLRQATSDQVVLAKTIPQIDYDGNGTPDFDPARIHFVGYSLGAISAVPLLGVSSDIQAASLPMGAGRLPYILQESSFYGPRINASLAAVNAALVPGSALYNTFFRDAQTALDSADGANYASLAVTLPAGSPRKIHMMYIVGGAANPAGGTWPADPTVPANRSQALAELLNLPVFTTSGAVTGNGAQVRLNSGIHNSYLDPRPAAAVTLEMQQQIAAFIATNGAAVNIANPTLVAQ